MTKDKKLKLMADSMKATRDEKVLTINSDSYSQPLIYVTKYIAFIGEACHEQHENSREPLSDGAFL